MRSTKQGLWNSSISRVRPVFRQLISRDRTGLSWLPKILELATCNKEFADRLAANPRSLMEENTKKRQYRHRVLKKYGVDEVDLEACFEKSLPLPERFLRWLIENPGEMTHIRANSI